MRAHCDYREAMDITVDLARTLIAAQFPQYADLGVTRAEPGGNDNRTFRIGAELSARLPSSEGYVAAVQKEHRWLPTLGRQLPVAVPEPVGLGMPGEGFPWPWSLNRWLPGEDALHARDINRAGLAVSIGRFLAALHSIDGMAGPAAGMHSFYRGSSLTHYNEETRSMLRTPGEADVWNNAMATQWLGAPTWFHGDLAPGNLLIEKSLLSAVIDWGTCGVGDPACDLAIAWTFFGCDERRMLAAEVALDADTWARARGWALWKALITGGAEAERVIVEVVADPIV